MTTPQDPRQSGPGQPPQSTAGIYQTPAPAGGPAATMPPRPSFFDAIRPEPTKAPPLEWVALVVSLILAISAVLPWVTVGDSTYNGFDTGQASGNGFLILAAGLGAAVLGFFGLSRDSISLAVGQALLGLITLIFTIGDLSPGAGASPAFGVYVALVASVVLIILSAYNAYDAFRKGAKY